ncbi:MAG: hypothetical protein PUC99_02740 [Eubacteriales bacterium]|jgi:hypothetical protein|nr:hypothetical protein [Lachnospiraceae bacterium]MDD5859240.1 hypothetical protein [Eubacteriales bacterium]MCH4063477.1 hypothetical protein [Lachnospiraceae bacterium]MCH4104626.1 hypothetical protein [Lachnospiraceae bacterium]MCI1379194.1 hypothetical protein [Lachnospiraceae bacterium]
MNMGKKISAAVLAAVVGCGLLAGCGSSRTKVDGTKTLLTVNDDSIDVGVGSFYVKYQQASMYKAYGSYFGSTGLFDYVTNSSTGETYGESMKESAIEDLEQMMLCKQHASDYNVALTDDQKTQIENAAQSYIDGNSESVQNMVGASKDDVVTLLELQTISSEMMDPMVADTDTTVTDDEAQQTSVTYVAVTADTTSSSSSSESAASSTESTSSEDASAAALSKAQAVLAAVKGQSDVANADMNTLASGVDSSLSATTGHFTTNDTTDGTVDSAIVSAVKGLSDGTLVDHVVTSSDGKTYYVVRLDKNFDQDQTDSKKSELVTSKKQDAYNALIEKWKKDATIKVNESAWSDVKITDDYGVTLKTASSAASSTEAAAESAASSTEAAASSTETAASAASSAG